MRPMAGSVVAPTARCRNRRRRRFISTSSRFTSLDNLVGNGEQRWRHRDAKHARRRVVDDELEFGRLLHRQLCGLHALEYTAGIDTPLTITLHDAWPVTH